MSYVSYLIARRVEILEGLSCENNCTEVNVADSKSELTHKAVLRMFRDDPDILDNNAVIGVFSALLFFYVVAEVFSILTMCGFFMKKEKKKEKKYHYKLGENVIVCIDGRYRKGIIHAQYANDKLHVVFSDCNVDELEVGIEASSSVTELLDISKQINNATASEIKACNTDITRLKNLLCDRLQIRELAADNLEAISGLGMYKKLQIKFPAAFKVLKMVMKLYRTYRSSKQMSLS